MTKAHANGIEIEYEVIGEVNAPPLLLIMGLGAQLIEWDDGFCSQLAARGFRVIRYDNRDVGLSTKFDAAGAPDLVQMLAARMNGEKITSSYTLDDMADDAAGLLDYLGIAAAHVIGASMGGMIAQAFAIRHGSRLLTLTSIMSSTGESDLPQPSPAAMSVLMAPAPADKQGYIDQYVVAARVLAGPGFPADEARARELASRKFDRDPRRTGMTRQLLAIAAAPGRREALRAVRVPTLVIHGSADPLIPLPAGIDTREAIPGSELLVIEGMGHQAPEPAWPQIIDGICALASRVPA